MGEIKTTHSVNPNGITTYRGLDVPRYAIGMGVTYGDGSVSSGPIPFREVMDGEATNGYGVCLPEGRVVVFISESHKLSEGQRQKLDDLPQYGGWQIWPVPAEGWSLSEMIQVKDWVLEGKYQVVFASPVPVLLGKLCIAAENTHICIIGVFHSDIRVSKEIRNPDGTVRVVHVVDPDSMEIVWL